MSDARDTQTVFDNNHIHDRWIAEYRNNRFQDSFNDAIIDRILSHVDTPIGGRVLDAGCGTGDHTLRFAKREFNVVGVDVSQSVLDKAQTNAFEQGLGSLTTFVRGELQDLSCFEDAYFDLVHCRGVLMHIPQWRNALSELCRVLRPGGCIVIMENNHMGLELRLVRLVRLFRKSDSSIKQSESGIEFHPTSDLNEPMTRIFNLDFLTRTLEHHGVRLISKFATEFSDIGRWPKGVVRNSVIHFNRFWFSFRLPSRLSLGNALIGRKS